MVGHPSSSTVKSRFPPRGSPSVRTPFGFSPLPFARQGCGRRAGWRWRLGAWPAPLIGSHEAGGRTAAPRAPRSVWDAGRSGFGWNQRRAGAGADALLLGACWSGILFLSGNKSGRKVPSKLLIGGSKRPVIQQKPQMRLILLPVTDLFTFPARRINYLDADSLKLVQKEEEKKSVFDTSVFSRLLPLPLPLPSTAAKSFNYLLWR